VPRAELCRRPDGPRIRQRLLDRHGVLVEVVPGDLLAGPQGKRGFDAQVRVLRLPDYLKPGQQAFQMAAQLALLEQGALIDRLIAEAGFDDAERIARRASACPTTTPARW
jgi:predicted transcriptional regulator